MSKSSPYLELIEQELIENDQIIGHFQSTLSSNYWLTQIFLTNFFFLLFFPHKHFIIVISQKGIYTYKVNRSIYKKSGKIEKLANDIDITSTTFTLTAGSGDNETLISSADEVVSFRYSPIGGGEKRLSVELSTSSSNADMEFDTAGTGKYIFQSTTSLTLPKGNTAQRPTAETGVIRFNTTTGQYEVSQDGSTYTNLRTDDNAANVTKDIFAGDGSTQQFTMSITPTDENNIVVYVDGVMQEPDQNYSISGTTINFGEGAHAGARIVVMHGFAD